MSTFKDSYGQIVEDGDTILIESTYGRPALNGRKAKVRWDALYGMYQFTPGGIYLPDDFYSIHKFKKVPDEK